MMWNLEQELMQDDSICCPLFAACGKNASRFSSLLTPELHWAVHLLGRRRKEWVVWVPSLTWNINHTGTSILHDALEGFIPVLLENTSYVRSCFSAPWNNQYQPVSLKQSNEEKKKKFNLRKWNVKTKALLWNSNGKSVEGLWSRV